MANGYVVKRADQVKGVPCPCGISRRVITAEDNDVASVHVTDISKDSQVHWHKNLSEIYYVLEGEGVLELDGDTIPASPGTMALIKPGTRHRARGSLRILVVVIPPFDPADEYLEP